MSLTDRSSIYAAELSAILEAIKWIIHNKSVDQSVDQSNFLILTDSLSVATSIKTNSSISRPNLFIELCQHINTIKYSQVVVARISSHVGLGGNNETLAKDGLKIEGKEITSLIGDETIKDGRRSTTLKGRDSSAKAQSPRYPQLSNTQIIPENGKYKSSG